MTGPSVYQVFSRASVACRLWRVISKLTTRITAANSALAMPSLAKVAGICREYGIAAGQPYPERLVTRCMAVSGHAYDRTIAENIVFAINNSKPVADIVIAGIVAMRCCDIGI
jgi:hypothetical protein